MPRARLRLSAAGRHALPLSRRLTPPLVRASALAALLGTLPRPRAATEAAATIIAGAAAGRVAPVGAEVAPVGESGAVRADVCLKVLLRTRPTELRLTGIDLRHRALSLTLRLALLLWHLIVMVIMVVVVLVVCHGG